ncbi:cell wall protein IFF6-like [Stegastes partitus]|uniref:Cell wall protein IFF6-like n=1 Tax=Stegastes partitus TaxID=144197 RepID=A0A9Y4JNF0_9TELE|nr:PREDICTED: cell wall protein IFF6-like [Stegastes partitus]
MMNFIKRFFVRPKSPGECQQRCERPLSPGDGHPPINWKECNPKYERPLTSRNVILSTIFELHGRRSERPWSEYNIWRRGRKGEKKDAEPSTMWTQLGQTDDSPSSSNDEPSGSWQAPKIRGESSSTEKNTTALFIRRQLGQRDDNPSSSNCELSGSWEAPTIRSDNTLSDEATNASSTWRQLRRRGESPSFEKKTKTSTPIWHLVLRGESSSSKTNPKTSTTMGNLGWRSESFSSKKKPKTSSIWRLLGRRGVGPSSSNYESSGSWEAPTIRSDSPLTEEATNASSTWRQLGRRGESPSFEKKAKTSTPTWHLGWRGGRVLAAGPTYDYLVLFTITNSTVSLAPHTVSSFISSWSLHLSTTSAPLTCHVVHLSLSCQSPVESSANCSSRVHVIVKFVSLIIPG